MNIAYVTMQFPVPSETFSSQDVEALRRQGHSVVVYGLRPRHKRHSQMMIERQHFDLRVINFGIRALWKFLTTCIFEPQVFFYILTWVFVKNRKAPRQLFKSVVLIPSVISIYSDLKKYKPDVVHLFWGHYPAMVGVLVHKFFSESLVSMFLGAHDLEENYAGSVDLANRVKLVFTHANSNLKALVQMGIDTDSVHVVHRGTKISVVNTGLERFNKMLDKPSFVTAARLIDEKGVDDVLRIFSSILDIYPMATLSIAGDGPQRKSLEALAADLGCADQVTFLGHIAQTELVSLMSRSNFFILMSRYAAERLPNALKEAMLQGCVVVTTRTLGIEELVHHAVNGFVVDMGDCRTAFESVKKCIASPPLAKSIACVARKHVLENFDVDASMRKYVSIWEEEIRVRRLG